MPAVTTRYQSPLNFQSVWINVEHTSELDGVNNNQVPSALSVKASTKNTWSLYVDGVAILQNYSFGSGYGAVTANSAQGGRYDLGGLVEKITYTKTTVSTVTSDVVTIGVTDAGPDGFGLIEGAAGSETVSWVRNISNNATTIKFKGVTINAGFLSQTGRSGDGSIINSPYGDVVFTASDDSVYTRGQHQYSTDTTDVYKVGRKLVDVTNTVTQDVVVLQDTDYAFWNISETTAAEIDNFAASVSLILPMHIMQRSLTQTGGLWSIRGLDLDESFIRVAADAAAGQVAITNLKNNYGIDAVQVPINLVVGTSFVKIALNNLEDVNVTEPLNNQIVKYQNGIWNGSFLDFADLSNKPTTISGFGITDAFTKAELNAGQLDNRYYTETEVDTNISTAITNILDGAPAQLDTLNELAAALDDDASYATTITSALALKSDISSLHAVATSGSYTDLINLPTITLTALGDSTITTPVANQVLKYDGAAWVNEFMAGGATLGAAPSTPLVGEFWFDDTTSGFLYTWNGYSWVQLTTTANSFDGTFSGLSNTPTTLSGYGITDAAAIGGIPPTEPTWTSPTASFGSDITGSSTTHTWTNTASDTDWVWIYIIGGGGGGSSANTQQGINGSTKVYVTQGQYVGSTAAIVVGNAGGHPGNNSVGGAGGDSSFDIGNPDGTLATADHVLTASGGPGGGNGAAGQGSLPTLILDPRVTGWGTIGTPQTGALSIAQHNSPLVMSNMFLPAGSPSDSFTTRSVGGTAFQPLGGTNAGIASYSGTALAGETGGSSGNDGLPGTWPGGGGGGTNNDGDGQGNRGAAGRVQVFVVSN